MYRKECSTWCTCYRCFNSRIVLSCLSLSASFAMIMPKSYFSSISIFCFTSSDSREVTLFCEERVMEDRREEKKGGSEGRVRGR